MYFAVVVMLMFVLPIASFAVEAVQGGSGWAALVVKWFVFREVGWRLLLAGMRQLVQPVYIACEILGLAGDEPLILVRELGFANRAFGAIVGRLRAELTK